MIVAILLRLIGDEGEWGNTVKPSTTNAPIFPAKRRNNAKRTHRRCMQVFDDDDADEDNEELAGNGLTILVFVVLLLW